MALDRLIKRERNAKCKRLKRLRRARDTASKHTKSKLLLSKVFKYYKYNRDDERKFLSDLVKDIFDNHRNITGESRPPKPPSSRPTIVKG